VLLVDNSASMAASAVARPTVEDLLPLTDHLGRCGGALALGALTDRAVPFVSAEVPPPPAPPAVRNTSGLDLISQATLAAEDEDAARRYRIALNAWRARATATLDHFRAEAQPLVEPANLSTVTDIRSGLLWTDAFLLEPRPIPVEHRRLVVIGYTDGKHDADALPVLPLRSEPEFLLVGTSGQGDLPFPTVPFTSMRSAVTFALTPRRTTP
jgi:hypothetical protein